MATTTEREQTDGDLFEENTNRPPRPTERRLVSLLFRVLLGMVVIAAVLGLGVYGSARLVGNIGRATPLNAADSPGCQGAS